MSIKPIIIIQNETNVTDLPSEEQLILWVDTALRKGVATPFAESPTMTVRWINKEESQQLNHHYRGKDYPTNVLSFPTAPLPGLPHTYLGDLAVCAPVLIEEAQKEEKSIAAHSAHLIVHGTLHLVGYDHQLDDEAQEMEGLETEILQELGFPDPYRES